MRAQEVTDSPQKTFSSGEMCGEKTTYFQGLRGLCPYNISLAYRFQIFATSSSSIKITTDKEKTPLTYPWGR